MKKVAVITGGNRGLGKSLVDLLIKEKDVFVLSLSRSIDIEHETCESLRFFKTDLSKTFSNESIIFLKQVVNQDSTIYYFNNASTIIPIKKVGDFEEKEIQQSLKINIEYPVIYINQLLQTFNRNRIELVNISSGAGVNPVPYWSLYGASKAYLTMFFKIIEEEDKGEKRVIVHNVDPGVMDTDMQAEIRKHDAPRKEYFTALKQENKLITPHAAAENVLEKINFWKL